MLNTRTLSPSLRTHHACALVELATQSPSYSQLDAIIDIRTLSSTYQKPCNDSQR